MNNKNFSFFLENKWELKSNEKQAFKIFDFKNFRRAFSWMTSIAFEAENQDHHPEWKNVYNKVSITLTTHDKGGITKLDYEMALFAESCFKNYT